MLVTPGTLVTSKLNTISILRQVRQGSYYITVSSALQAALGPVEVIQNAIPFEWRNLEKFKGRVEEVRGSNHMTLFAYIGAFEVYHEDVLLFSKLSSRLWPNCKVVAEKIKNYFQDKKNKATDLSKYSIKYSHPSSKLPGNSCRFHV